MNNLPATLNACNTEEEVKSEFAKAFGFKLDTRKRMDLYTTRILFEFKLNKSLENLDAKSLVLAQTMYYIRQIKFGRSDLALPPFICVVDKNQALMVETLKFRKIYSSENPDFDWDRAPSTPCPNIVNAVKNSEITRSAHVYDFNSQEDFSNFVLLLQKAQTEQLTLEFSIDDKKEITEQNFDAAYELWRDLFGPYVQDGRKVSEYFLADIQEAKSQILTDSHEVVFDIGNDLMVRKPIPLEKYKYYWNTYNKCQDLKVIHSIWQRVDRLSVEDFRRFTGEFYTPVEVASKGLDYIIKTIGDKWWEKGYRFWDMAAGTGNLEYFLPEDALQYCYISTLLQEDADYCAKLYPQATTFQYDYLNDDVNLLHNSGIDLFKSGVKPKLPLQLFHDLNNPELKWIIFINPPFATANVKGAGESVSKDAVSMTAVRELMNNEDLGETSRELFAQFLWRISRDFQNKTAHLGMFSTLKYINANNDQKMRDSFFRYRFERGFCFPATTFQGNKGKFPIGFLVWNLSEDISLQDQSITLDVFNLNFEKEGFKDFPSVNRTEALSKWVPRPRTSRILPPLTSAISVGDSHKDVRDKVANGFLFSLMANGNDFQHQNLTSLLSGPYVSAGAFSVTAENFEKAMVMHAVRKVPKATWLNDRDQWMAPTVEPLDYDFVTDCVIWSIFSSSNVTASISDIEYKGSTYDLRNALFPFPLSEVRNWPCSLNLIRDSMLAAQSDSFLVEWLATRRVSTESQVILEKARGVYKLFFGISSSLPWPQFKIKKWDVGWYQIRRAILESDHGDVHAHLFSEIADLNQRLADRLYPQIREYGFMQSIEYKFGEEVT